MPRHRADDDLESHRRSKRTRRDVDYPDEDDSEDEIRPAPKQRKKLRLGVSQQSEEEFESDEIEPDQARPQSSRHSAGNGAIVDEKEEKNDMMEDDDDDDDMGDEIETDQLKFHARKGFASSGILHSVQLDRFMSHECFKYELGPNVNFICGQNGSGKSAIVAAVQIGLLGGVNVTERARKLEDLIKHGRDSCVITIKIWNRKPLESSSGHVEADMTYKHDEYGDMITVERRIYRKGRGSNSFSVKGRNRKPIKLPPGRTTRQEVQAIVDHFGFMVDNPVSVLTQTKSKEFLSKGKPADNHKLYRRATLLGPLEDELDNTKSVTREVEDMLRKKQKCMPEVQANLAKKEAAHNEAQEMKNIGDRIHEAEIKFAWTLVQEAEITFQKNEERTNTQFEPAAEKARFEHEKSQKRIDELSDQREKAREQAQEATERLNVIKSKFYDSHRAMKKIDFDLNHQRRRIQEFEAEIDSLDGSIGRTKQKMEEARASHFAGQEQKSRLVQEVKDIDSRIDTLEADMASARERDSSQQGEKLKLEDDAMRAAEEARRLERDLEVKRREHMQAESYARNRDNLARFGETVPSICRRIAQNQGRFHRTPIGPIGRHVRMEDESWAAAIEMAVGFHTLCTFIVHDSHDSQLLESFFPDRGYRPTILIANVDRERYQISSADMPDVHPLGHHTILDMIRVEHNAVFNFLVDQSQIERNVLNHRDQDITQLGWSRMRNLQMVWNKSCDRAYTRNGSNTFRHARGSTNARLLSRDMRPYLQSLTQNLEVIGNDLREANERKHAAETRVRGLSDVIRRTRRDIGGMQGRKVELTERKAALEDQLNQAENAFDPTPFEQQISAFQTGIEEQNAQIAGSRDRLRDLEASRVRLEGETADAQREQREARQETTDRSAELERASTVLARVKSKHRQLQKDVEQSERVLAQAREELKQQQNNIVGKMEQARSFGECPSDVDPVKRPSAKCSQYVKNLKSKLQAEQERRGGRTAREIEMDWLVAKRKDKENKEVLDRIQYYVTALNRGIKTRERNLLALTKYLKKLVRSNFRTFLSKRGHSGTISFRHDNGVPELHFITKMATHDIANKEGADTKNLSGGERSYTTLSFILSLAEICQNPVRILDEVDCFQDEASRKVSYEQTVEFFRTYLPNRQVVIITPQPLPHNAVKQTNYCKVVRLRPPRDADDTQFRQTNLGEYGVA